MKSAIDIIKSSKKIIAISNLKCTEAIESYTRDYDCIIRFNKGSNEKVLNQHSFYNKQTDICCLSGWNDGDFGHMVGFLNKPILFSRPQYDTNIKYLYKKIYVRKDFLDKINPYTRNISFINWKVFSDFYDIYSYDHPTTGLITLWYIKHYLRKNIECVNFMQDSGYYNAFIDKSSVDHNFDLEKTILEELKINNHII